MRPFLFCVAILLLLSAGRPRVLRAQSGSAEPGLKHRAAEEAEDGLGPDWAGLQRGHTTLPRQAWGEYPLGSPGEVIEVDLQDRRLTGYISRQGDRESDKGTALTYFFARSTISGTRVSFETRAIHGVWYSFSGELVRGGPDRSTGEPGYMLQGMLTEHSRQQGAEQARRVSLRRLPIFSGR